jgi:glucose-6-phosphate isomerase
MLTKNIKFENFSKKKNYSFIKRELKKLLGDRLKKDNLLNTLTNRYNYSFKKKLIYKLKKFSNIRIIGMGGSILGTEAIYNFLRHKIKKKFYFFNNLNVFFNKINNNKTLNLIVSKSGNTLETISNANILINKRSKNIFITETKNSYLTKLANKLKSEIVEHKNFVGGRYSVLSEVGMLPSELMGLSEKKFKQLNNLIKNKNFLNNLTVNVSTIIDLLNNGKFTSVILNYDDRSESLFRWYQQLVAESLGKKGKGILPIVSTMPRDNHSLMQFYLDGPKKNFFTFFYVFDKQSEKIKNNQLLPSHIYLKNKTISKIIYSQKVATEKIFLKKKIHFRSFEIFNRNEQTLGELFCFFILETILLGRALKINPFDQPSVELIKKETKKILI